MACKNNMNSNSNLGRVIDFDVVYTGCGSLCYGEEIKAGMTLRTILDILVNNCGGGGGIETVNWGDILGDIADQTDLVQFITQSIESSIQVAIDGPIQSNIDTSIAQALSEFQGFGVDNVGKNLNFSSDNKVNLGIYSPGFEDVVVITQDGQFPPAAGKSYLLLADDNFGGVDLNSGGGALNVNSGGGALNVNSGGGALNVNSGGGLLTIGDSSRLQISYTGISVEGPSGLLSVGNIGIFGNQSGVCMAKQNTGSSSGIVGLGSIGSEEIIVYKYSNSVSAHQPPTFRYQVSPTLTDELQIVHKGYVDALEATVTALESRVLALENA